MDTKRIPTFREVATNYDGDQAEEFFLAEGRRMILEGKKPDRIKVAMVQAGFRLAKEHNVEYGGFLRSLQAVVQKEIDNLSSDFLRDLLNSDRLKDKH